MLRPPDHLTTPLQRAGWYLFLLLLAYGPALTLALAVGWFVGQVHFGGCS